MKHGSIRKAILIIDACNSAAIFDSLRNSQSAEQALLWQPADLPQGIAAMSSTSKWSKSWQKPELASTLFSKMFCRAIRNWGDTQSPYINLPQLKNFINKLIDDFSPNEDQEVHLSISEGGSDIWIALNRFYFENKREVDDERRLIISQRSHDYFNEAKIHSFRRETAATTQQSAKRTVTYFLGKGDLLLLLLWESNEESNLVADVNSSVSVIIDAVFNSIIEEVVDTGRIVYQKAFAFSFQAVNEGVKIVKKENSNYSSRKLGAKACMMIKAGHKVNLASIGDCNGLLRILTEENEIHLVPTQPSENYDLERTAQISHQNTTFPLGFLDYIGEIEITTAVLGAEFDFAMLTSFGSPLSSLENEESLKEFANMSSTECARFLCSLSTVPDENLISVLEIV